MHCNLRPPEPCQPFPALITTPCQVRCHRTYPFVYLWWNRTRVHRRIQRKIKKDKWTKNWRIIAFLLLIRNFTMWPWPLTLWPWSLTFVIEYLHSAIWTQSNNPRRSYCDFSVWPYDLEHCVTCCARLWDNFHQVWPATTYPCLNYSVF